MTITSLLTQSCLILRRDPAGTEDEYGNEEQTETTETTVCSLQQNTSRQGNEPGGLGETSDTFWSLFLPAETVIDTGDAVEVDGERFELVGEPWQVKDPLTGAGHHVEAIVRRTAGSEDAS